MKEYLFEPDFVSFTHNGLKCQIVRHHFGFLNAYVLIPKGNKFYGMDELDLNMALNPSTEITFSEEVDGFWKIGVSFSSIKDFIPFEPNNELKEFIDKFQKSLGIESAKEPDYKNIEYAISEIKKITNSLFSSMN